MAKKAPKTVEKPRFARNRRILQETAQDLPGAPQFWHVVKEGMPEHRNAGTPECRNTGMPEHLNAGTPECRNTGISFSL
jgi:hypothetical protein